MLAGQGFSGWGFILGNVLIAFGAPVLVTSLVSAGASARGDLPVRREDIAAIAAGAAFMLAGLLLALLAGRTRGAGAPLPYRIPYQAAPGAVQVPVRAGDSFGGSRVGRNPTIDLNFGLDDYYNSSPGTLALEDEPSDTPTHGILPVQRKPSGAHRNSRAWAAADRFHQPTVTGMRSSGTRRRPPAE